jgi:hypothetical protein
MALWYFCFWKGGHILIMIRKPEIKERNKQITGDNMHCMHSTCNSRWFSTYVHDHQFWLALSLYRWMNMKAPSEKRNKQLNTISFNGVVIESEPSVCIHSAIRKRRCRICWFLCQSLRLFRSSLRRIPQVDFISLIFSILYKINIINVAKHWLID